jgi:hypothetical protein
MKYICTPIEVINQAALPDPTQVLPPKCQVTTLSVSLGEGGPLARRFTGQHPHQLGRAGQLRARSSP